MIDTQDLTKFYGRTRGIEGLSLHVDSGEFFGFIGPNGAGKSTTIRTLLGLLRPTRGTATVFGLDSVIDGIAIRRRLGYVPAEPGFYNRMTGDSILRLSSRIHGVSTLRGHEIANQLDLDLTRNADELSTGNRKKLAIVLALQHHPELLVLDEPTAGLDPLIQGVFFELLRRENEQGSTILFSSHVLDDVQRMCRRVAIVRNGKAVEVAEIEELRQRHLKQVRAIFDKPVGRQQILLDGLSNVELKGEEIRFSFTGSLRSLLVALSEQPLVDLTIESPTLDEVFLHYYGIQDDGETV